MRYRAICNNREFSRIYAKGKSYVHPQVVLYVFKTKNRPTKVGFTATKKIGNAVKRNRARRVMKAALAEHLPADTRGFDLVLVARGQTPFLKSTQLSKTLGKLFAKAGLEDKAVLARQVATPQLVEQQLVPVPVPVVNEIAPQPVEQEIMTQPAEQEIAPVQSVCSEQETLS